VLFIPLVNAYEVKAAINVIAGNSVSCMHASHTVTCNYINGCLYLVSVHQMTPPQIEVADI